jgi:hypothetical protein
MGHHTDAAANRQPSESDVVHDHVGPGEHQIVAIPCVVVGIGARHVEHADRTGCREIMGGSLSSSERATDRGSTEMISNRRSYANLT